MPHRPRIEYLKIINDIEGLGKALRCQDEAERRRGAAAALGELDALQASENLIRSYLEDPDSEVRSASYSALIQLLGNQVDDAIAIYRNDPQDTEPWLLEEPPVDPVVLQVSDSDVDSILDLSPAAPSISAEPDFWSKQEISTLTTIIKRSSDTNLKLLAIHELAANWQAPAVEALIEVALWSNETKVRRAAAEALETIYGDEYNTVLQTYRAANPDSEDDYDLDDDMEDMEEPE